MIKISNVSKSYSNEIVLNNLNFEISQGEKIAICGPSGSGKSTLLKCLIGIEDHDSGEIFIDNVLLDKTDKTKKQVRSKVSFVFQNFNLFPHLNVMSNLTLPLIKVLKLSKNEAEKIALENLKKVFMAEHVNKFINELSGGQQQRVAIARALCINAKIICLDEPTSSLDPELVKEVLDTILNLSKDNITIICVTHEMAFAKKMADKILFLDKGNLISFTDTDVFFNYSNELRVKNFLDKLLI